MSRSTNRDINAKFPRWRYSGDTSFEMLKRDRNVSTEQCLTDVIKSNSFANMSGVYFRYLKTTSSVGLIVGIIGTIAYLLDCKKENSVMKKMIMNVTGKKDESVFSKSELSNCTNSHFYNFAICVIGPLLGVTFGVIYPCVIVVVPIYYAFGSNCGIIMNAILLLATNDKKKKLEDEEK